MRERKKKRRENAYEALGDFIVTCMHVHHFCIWITPLVFFEGSIWITLEKHKKLKLYMLGNLGQDDPWQVATCGFDSTNKRILNPINKRDWILPIKNIKL